MKITRIIAVVVGMVLLVACKSEQKEPEVISVEHKKEEVKKAEIAENAVIENAKFNIKGMTCAVGCAAKIEKSLANMDGVTNAKVDFETKTATVSYDVAKVNTDLLAERVVKTGEMYSVENMEKVSGKSCTMNKGNEKCNIKCSKECTKKDCEKCSAKKAECEKKCGTKMSSCNKKKTCKANNSKTCAAKEESNKCKSDCEKACCAKKA